MVGWSTRLQQEAWFKFFFVFFRNFLRICWTFFFFIYIIYLILAVLGLRCCTQAFSSCGERGLLFLAVHRLLIAVASLVVEHGL